MTQAIVRAPLTLGTALASGSSAHAALSLPVISGIGCDVFNFFTGELAVWAFILIFSGTLVIGLMARVDFAKLISAVVIFGILQGLGGWLTSSGKISTPACLGSAS
ncbi:MAG: hypothetical protein Q7T63_07315 [Burkholderiaceae bacterium]|nr:hypothetical protein [Burkholderiaceae bacterium]